MRFWLYLMTLLGSLKKILFTSVPRYHLQFVHSVDMMECFFLVIQSLGVGRPEMIGISLNGLHWLFVKMGCPEM
jgi:hypothetical protein